MTLPTPLPIAQFRDVPHLAALAKQLHHLLSTELGLAEPLSESRARAILRAAQVLDEATQASFVRLVQNEKSLRLALHDLCQSTAVSLTFIPPYPTEAPEIPWLSLVLLAFARKNGYPVGNLNPAVPPAPHTPAGLLLQQVGGYFRQQTQRSATERDKLAKPLAYSGDPTNPNPNLTDPAPIAPVPPYFRTPVPVRYPEYNPPVAVETEELPASNYLVIAPEETTTPPPARPSSAPRSAPAPSRQPALQITAEEVMPPPINIVGTPVTVPRPAEPARPTGSNLLDNIRNLFKGEEFASTRLRVLVQEYPDGPGLYGLQVKVSCRGVRSFVAGTTDREGRFVCELPVRETSGLTYEVEVIWPRETGGETEQKSITLSADREAYELPFYRQLRP
jgi:hypothetical protein